MTNDRWNELQSLKPPFWAVGTKEPGFDYWIALYTRIEKSDSEITLYKLLELYHTGSCWRCMVYKDNSQNSSVLKISKGDLDTSTSQYRKEYNNPELFRQVIQTVFSAPYLRWRGGIKGEFGHVY